MKKNIKLVLAFSILIVFVGLVTLVLKLGERTKLASNEPVNTLSDAQEQSYVAKTVPALTENDKVFGSIKAPLMIFVYEDYTSPYSAVLADTLDRINAETAGKSAVVVRPYVVKNSSLALQAALAVDCAAEQDKWKEMRALLFNKAKNQQLINDSFLSYAKQINLDEEKFQTCLTNLVKSGKIEQLALEAQGYGVQGTPTMFIGEEMILGARPYDDFEDSNGDKIEGLKALISKKLQ